MFFLAKVLAFWGQWSKSRHKQCKADSSMKLHAGTLRSLAGGSVRRQADLNEQSLFSFFVLLQFPADHPKFLRLVKQTNIPQQLLPHAVFAWKARFHKGNSWKLHSLGVDQFPGLDLGGKTYPVNHEEARLIMLPTWPTSSCASSLLIKSFTCPERFCTSSEFTKSFTLWAASVRLSDPTTSWFFAEEDGNQWGRRGTKCRHQIEYPKWHTLDANAWQCKPKKTHVEHCIWLPQIWGTNPKVPKVPTTKTEDVSFQC